MTDLADAIAQLPVSMVARLVRWSDPEGLGDRDDDAIQPRSSSGDSPLSHAQERLWFLSQLQPGNTAYNLVTTIAVAESVEILTVQRALDVVISRHEALRTTFMMSAGVPVQRILPTISVAVDEMAPGDAESAIAGEAVHVFDLQKGPLLRARLIRWDGSQALLLVNMHHIISDGMSVAVFTREFEACLAAIRRGAAPVLPDLPIQYADFAEWQREHLRGDRLGNHLDYWRERLAGAPPLLDLPTDKPRPATESHRGATQMFSIPPDVTMGLRALARDCHATLFMVLLAAFQALLSRLTGTRDIVVGSPIANRNRAELENLIGFFVNMLALRSEVAPEMSLRELVGRVRETTLGAYEHQDLPFEKLVEELHPPRSLSHGPIHQIVLVLQNMDTQTTGDAAEIADPEADPIFIEGTAKFDLTLFLTERGEGLFGSCEYPTDLFEHRGIARLIRRFKQILVAVTRDSDQAVWQLPVTLADEAAPERRRIQVSGWPAAGQAAATALGLSSRARLAAFGDLAELARAAAQASGATPIDVTLQTLAASRASHLLIRPEQLAGLPDDAVPAGMVIAVVGLPCFAPVVSRWSKHRVIGLWGVPAAPCCARLMVDEREASIAAALDGFWIEILDERQRRQAVDVWGEICIGGALLPQATALIADAFAPGEQLHRTGLIGRRRGDRRIELLGAAGRLIRCDGRVDPARLEALLWQHPAVAAAQVDIGDDAGEHWLDATVAPRPGCDLDEQTLRRYAAAYLPAGLLPRRISIAADLTEAAAAPPRQPENPATPVQAVIARIWSDVLKRPVRDIGANFFDIGGNSVTSVQVIARIRDTLHVELPLHRLFEAPTIAKLAALVEADHATVLEIGSAAPENSAEIVPARIGRIHRAPPGPRRLRAPLSFAQERLWFLDQFQPASPVYNLAINLPLDADADLKHVRRALTAITALHEALRTSFPAVGGAPQQVIDPAAPVAVAVSDIAKLEPRRSDEEFARILAAATHEPFDLARGPLLCARLIRAGESGTFLSLVVHHIVFDGWSFDILLREFDHFYRGFRAGGEPALPDLPVQYADFARWQRRWMAHPVFRDHLAYWRGCLADAPDILQLPTDRPRPAIETHRGATQYFVLDGPVTDGLRGIARRSGTTLFVVLLAAFKVLLMRWSGQEDIVVGSPIANRTRLEIEHLIGFFTNTLVLRTDLSGNPDFIDLVARVHRAMLAATEHQDMPFEKIVEELQPRRSLDRNPLFQAMLVLHNAGPLGDAADVGQDADADPRIVLGTSKFDVTLTLIETGGGLAANIEYNSDLFDDMTITGAIRQFRALVASVVADPGGRIGELPMMTPPDRRRVMQHSWGGNAGATAQTVCDLVAARIARHPSAPAIIVGDRVIDYATLGHRADALTRRLRRRGVASGDRVAISLPRSADALIALLAILKLGAAYVPVDPAYPQARRDFILRDSRAVLLIRPAGSGAAPHGVRVLNLKMRAAAAAKGKEIGSEATADGIAYVIYTSGSTGTPKGVAVPHRALTNLIQWQIALDQEIEPERTLQFTSLSFDVSFQEIFATWGAGGALVLIDDATRADPGELLAAMTRHRVHRLFLPAVALQQIADTARGQPLPPLREVIAAGEQLRITPAISQLFQRLGNCRLRNQYGPTETHIVTDYLLAGPPESWPVLPPIGRPIPNVSAYVLDRFGQPVPDGVPGDIFIGGACVATGYHDRPDLTAERFLPDPRRPGERMYRTGDLGRRLPSGDIAYLGRGDHQVKVRGYRIEPGEIERALTEIPGIAEAVVVASGDAADTKRLIAYVVTAASLHDLQNIRDVLARRLPDYMVPWPIVAVDTLPLTPSGKIDRGALARAPIAAMGDNINAAAPALPLEQLLADHWKDLLGVAGIGIDDDFFQSGGHSLLATRAMSRLHQDIGLMLPVRTLFATPTIRGLARAVIEAIAERVAGAGGEALIKKLDAATGRVAA